MARTIDPKASAALEAANKQFGEDLVKAPASGKENAIPNMNTALLKANVVAMGACDSLIAAKL